MVIIKLPGTWQAFSHEIFKFHHHSDEAVSSFIWRGGKNKIELIKL